MSVYDTGGHWCLRCTVQVRHEGLALRRCDVGVEVRRAEVLLPDDGINVLRGLGFRA